MVSQATGITGAVFGAILGVTFSTPLFMGNAIAKEFHHSFPVSNNTAIGMIEKSTKVGHRTGNHAAEKTGHVITNAASKLNTEIGDRKEHNNATLGAIQNHQSK